MTGGRSGYLSSPMQKYPTVIGEQRSVVESIIASGLSAPFNLTVTVVSAILRLVNRQARSTGHCQLEGQLHAAQCGFWQRQQQVGLPLLSNRRPPAVLLPCRDACNCLFPPWQPLSPTRPSPRVQTLGRER